MLDLCTPLQLAQRCIKNVAARPQRYTLAWLCAAAMMASTQIAQRQLQTLADAADLPGWLAVAAVVGLFLFATLWSIAHYAFSCSAAVGLPLGAQVVLLKNRFWALANCGIRYMYTLLWYIFKPLLVCWLVTGFAAYAVHRFGLLSQMGTGPGEIVIILGGVEAIVCAVWGSLLAAARLLLAPALVMQGVPAKESMQQAKLRSNHARGWLLKGYVWLCIPTLLVGGVAGALASMAVLGSSPAAGMSPSLMWLVHVVNVLWAPLPASLSMIALQALAPAPLEPTECMQAA